MMLGKISKSLLAVICLLWLPAFCSADFDIVFADGDQFDGDTVGGTATFNDPVTGVDATLTTTGGHSGITLNTDAVFLAPGPSNPNLWSSGEFWSFEWNAPMLLESISFNQLDASEKVTMQCDDWIGQGFVPGDPDRVVFDNATGSFILDRGFTGGGFQTWTASDMTGGASLMVNPESDITFTLTDFTTVLMTGMSWTALPTLVTADSFAALLGSHTGGTLEDTYDSDDQRLCHLTGHAFSPFLPSLILEFEGTLPSDSPNSLSILVEGRVNDIGIEQGIQMYNFDTGSFEIVDTRPMPFNADDVADVELTGDVTRFVEAGTGLVRTRVTYKSDGTGFFTAWEGCVDQLVWKPQ